MTDQSQSVIRATFHSMGIRAEKGIGIYLLENAYDSNLIPDISTVDYLTEHQGRTHLSPLEGLPLFVDDIYVYGYVSRQNVVVAKGKVLRSSGENGYAKQVVVAIHGGIQNSFGRDQKFVHTSIVNTINAKSIGVIGSMVRRVERETENKTLDAWKRIYGENPYEIFVTKLDVSEIPIEDIEAGIPNFQRQLAPHGFGLYSIDYTRDFSGVLDHPTLVKYLTRNFGMRMQGDMASAICESRATILDNTDSVGNYVCTYVQTTLDGYTIRVKLYNNIISNFEAGEVRENFGGHLADYTDCPNQHLKMCREEDAQG